MVYLISYEIADKEREAKLVEDIKSSGDYCNPINNQWFISVNQGALSTYQRLIQHLNTSDKLLIAEITRKREALLDKDCIEWLKAHGA